MHWFTGELPLQKNKFAILNIVFYYFLTIHINWNVYQFNLYFWNQIIFVPKQGKKKSKFAVNQNAGL